MSTENQDFEPEESEEPAEPNGDLASWLYVVCGIPAMILFFLVYFGTIGSCDATDVMIYG